MNNSTRLFTFKTIKAPENINSLFQTRLQKFQALYLTALQQEISMLVDRTIVSPEQVERMVNTYREANDRLLEIYDEFDEYKEIITPSFLSFSLREYMKSAMEVIVSLSQNKLVVNVLVDKYNEKW